MWIDTGLRTLLIATATERYACVEAISPEKSTVRRDIDTHVVAVGIVAVNRPDLVIHEAELQNMSSTTSGIERNSIVHDGFDIQRGFTGAEVGLDHIQAVVGG